MTNRVTHGRQWKLVLEQEFDYTDLLTAALSSGNSAVQPKLPQGAIVLGGGVLVETAFNGTTPTADVGVSGTGNLYINDVDLATTGYKAFTGGQTLKSTGETMLIAPNAGAAASSAGKGRIIVEYIIAGRANEVQP